MLSAEWGTQHTHCRRYAEMPKYVSLWVANKTALLAVAAYFPAQDLSCSHIMQQLLLELQYPDTSCVG